MTEIELNGDAVKFFQQKILIAGKKLFTPYEWRNTGNKFHALTAEIMLQRTNAEQVLAVYKDFTRKYKTAAQFVDFPENIFFSLGLNWRYDVFRRLCYFLAGMKKIPETREELIRLPGIGEYISSAFLSLHLNKREFIIDSNIVRLYGRYFGFITDGETRRKKWLKKIADELTPSKKFWNYNYGLLDFTRTICKKKPECESCLLKMRCNYYKSQVLRLYPPVFKLLPDDKIPLPSPEFKAPGGRLH